VPLLFAVQFWMICTFSLALNEKNLKCLVYSNCALLRCTCINSLFARQTCDYGSHLSCFFRIVSLGPSERHLWSFFVAVVIAVVVVVANGPTNLWYRRLIRYLQTKSCKNCRLVDCLLLWSKCLECTNQVQKNA